MISFQNISKTFRIHEKQPGLKASIKSLFHRKWVEKHALKSVSATIEAGEILGLVGANGAGKTTLVKILSGIVHPTSGTASIGGFTPWERNAAFRKQIALIMGQKAQLWWDLPAADCFILLREIYRIPEKKHRENLAYLSDALDVKAQLNTQIRRLSLGERMKMELIAALLHEPKVVFLDEPTIGLDITAQRAIRKFILDYRKSHQPAMILTSHYMEDIESLCKRIIIIREGEFVYDGSLSQVHQQHANYKILVVRLGGELSGDAFDPRWGEKVLQSSSELRIKVKRDQVPDVAGAVLKTLPVADLGIEEEDIGTVIEKLMKRAIT